VPQARANRARQKKIRQPSNDIIRAGVLRVRFLA
jgi:hypothetical protein